ncbi:hypothetical protein [Halobaculum magnesiiphilum]|uniref:Uncharacterized protein n=1 Tax=Halobaculum magnesiiphilum TaxID=1017351 RepID=A0A8T8WB69_9EURY|nr:hypothetical protein [Halobaculum magnesiiphilum]QZP37077.1 hypothetical protein K6T50_12365 [Halobaculum magnesiiphilum]
MAVEFSPNGRGMIVVIALLATAVIWSQTSGSPLTLLVIASVIAVAALLTWGLGTRVMRRVGGMR